jgi:hypothetical protein
MPNVSKVSPCYQDCACGRGSVSGLVGEKMQGVLDCSLMSTAAFCLCLTVESLARHTTLCPSGAVTRSDLAARWSDLFCCLHVFFFIDNENNRCLRKSI